MASAILFWTYNDSAPPPPPTLSFFFSRCGMVLPDEPLTAHLELGEALQIFAIPMKAPKINCPGEERGVCFGLMENFVSTSWRDSWGPLLPRLASPRLAGSSLACSRQAQAGICQAVDFLESSQFGFLLGPSSGELSGRV